MAKTRDRDRPVDPTFWLAGLDYEPEISDPDADRARRAVETLPRLTFIVFKMLAVRRIGVRRAARRLRMPSYCVRRQLITAIAHLAVAMRSDDER